MVRQIGGTSRVFYAVNERMIQRCQIVTIITSAYIVKFLLQGFSTIEWKVWL